MNRRTLPVSWKAPLAVTAILTVSLILIQAAAR